jgi:hypothetical protein
MVSPQTEMAGVQRESLVVEERIRDAVSRGRGHLRADLLSLPADISQSQLLQALLRMQECGKIVVNAVARCPNGHEFWHGTYREIQTELEFPHRCDDCTMLYGDGEPYEIDREDASVALGFSITSAWRDAIDDQKKKSKRFKKRRR